MCNDDFDPHKATRSCAHCPAAYCDECFAIKHNITKPQNLPVIRRSRCNKCGKSNTTDRYLRGRRNVDRLLHERYIGMMHIMERKEGLLRLADFYNDTKQYDSYLEKVTEAMWDHVHRGVASSKIMGWLTSYNRRKHTHARPPCKPFKKRQKMLDLPKQLIARATNAHYERCNHEQADAFLFFNVGV